MRIGGTSAATPLFGGALALIGEQAKRTRRPMPGFVNPLLFALARKAGGSRGPCCTTGPNHDSASGLGSLGLRAFMDEALGEPR